MGRLTGIDPRFAVKRDNWKWKILLNPRRKKQGTLYSTDPEDEVKPPEGHLWLRVIIWKHGKQYRRYMAIKKADAKKPAVAEMYAKRFRESIRGREGI